MKCTPKKLNRLVTSCVSFVEMAENSFRLHFHAASG